jgi:hypothetical protein
MREHLESRRGVKQGDVWQPLHTHLMNKPNCRTSTSIQVAVSNSGTSVQKLISKAAAGGRVRTCRAKRLQNESTRDALRQQALGVAELIDDAYRLV